MPLDWNMVNLVLFKLLLTNTADFIQTISALRVSLQEVLGVIVGSRWLHLGGEARPCEDFLPFRYWCFLMFILAQFLPHSFSRVWRLLWGFPLLRGLTWWLFTAINPSDRGTSVMLYTSGGRCWWHVLLCCHSPLPSRREREEEEEESAHWVSHDPAGARVGRWWVDKLWGSVQMSNEVTI